MKNNAFFPGSQNERSWLNTYTQTRKIYLSSFTLSCASFISPSTFFLIFIHQFPSSSTGRQFFWKQPWWCSLTEWKSLFRLLPVSLLTRRFANCTVTISGNVSIPPKWAVVEDTFNTSIGPLEASPSLFHKEVGTHIVMYLVKVVWNVPSTLITMILNSLGKWNKLTPQCYHIAERTWWKQLHMWKV